MKYNPQIHHRRTIRLKGYDYSQAGLYFVTICCQDRICRFGKIVNHEMILNEFGTIAYNEWIKLHERFSNFELDVFQIMPNHMHGIILLNDDVARAPLAGAQNTGMQINHIQNANNKTNLESPSGQPKQHSPSGQPQGIVPANTTVGNMVGAYKSLVFNACLDNYKMKNETMGKLWHRNYYEHIIRNEKSYINISEYIINNPSKWNDDKFFTLGE